ncbi:hypothetical protein [Halobacillus sp. A5]|uniref:hypothetical protein n=1 Tax=Halobacillus sp. A5 TaxID=2880263 RepID=UPI0020A63D80|nr:hypothetical protein [Halobacillus sp. A5]MCP3026811.1 hypothetical protein [Halobacillus sp. A5]
MTERQWLWINFGSVTAFIFFILLSLITGGQDALVIMTEILAVLALIVAGVTIVYHRSEAMWVAVAAAAYIVPWGVFAAGYELAVEQTTSYYHLWFIFFYIAFTAAVVFLRKSFKQLNDEFKLFPVFLLFFHAMLLLYMIFLHIWWLLPF